MSRRGVMEGWYLVAILMVIIVIVTFVVIHYTKTNAAREQIDSLQACEGFLGTLGGKEGRCFNDSETKCGGNVDASQDTYFQYIGKGWGCPEATHCCVQLDKNSNPLRATDVNRAKCTSELKEGEWAIQSGIGCTKMPTEKPLEVRTTDQLTFIYKPRSGDRFCEVHMNIPKVPAEHAIAYPEVDTKGCWGARNAENVVVVTSSVQRYMDDVFEKYGRTRTYNDRIDRAWLNNPQSFTVHLLAGERPMQPLVFTLSTTPSGTQYCPVSSTNLCANQPVGSRPSTATVGSCEWVQGGALCDLK